ncbi:YolD-like family protein [Paenibacillus agricola]|nr:YolD-like family protein [Paenibacillus agricola]
MAAVLIPAHRSMLIAFHVEQFFVTMAELTEDSLEELQYKITESMEACTPIRIRLLADHSFV